MSLVHSDPDLVFDPDAVAREHGEEPLPDRHADRPVLLYLDRVEPRAVDWLWPGRIPLGKLTLLVGDPGLGKSSASLDLVARLTRGERWPDGSAGRVGSAVLLSAEDDADDTIVPRLIACGADRSKAAMLTAVRTNGEERSFCLDRDIAALDCAIAETGATLVVIDPVTAYLGVSIDAHVDADIRRVLTPLAKIAGDRHVAILCIAHLNKTTSTRALYRIGGSIGLVAAARAVFAVVEDPGDREGGRRLLVPIKANLAEKAPTLAFSIRDGSVAWEVAPVASIDVEAAMRGPVATGEHDGSSLAEAMAFLESELGDGPRRADDISRAARQAGISNATLRRAKDAAGVRSNRISEAGSRGAGVWLWSLGDADQGARPPYLNSEHLDGKPISTALGIKVLTPAYEGNGHLDDPMLSAARATGLVRP